MPDLQSLLLWSDYHKIWPGAYIFQSPFYEALVCVGVYILWEICVTKSLRLAYSYQANKNIMVTVPYLLCFTSCLSAISVKDPGAYISRGGGRYYITESFLPIFGRAYFFGILRYLTLSDRGQHT